jgi:EAL domain-containing protein (putative c-di-GMP-specific phosphodiesterase class I)
VANDIARGVLAFFNAPIAVDGGAVRISTSIGVVHRLGRECGALDLLKRADTAMYEAKRRGGNTIACYDRDIGDKRKRELDRATRLRAVMDSKSVTIDYCPIVQAASEQIVGVAAEPKWAITGETAEGEALQRLIEENDLVPQFLAAVLARAFTDALPWQGIMLNMRLPGALLQSRDFAAIVRKILARARFPAERLKIEISEADIEADRGSILEGLAELAAEGVSLKLRNFGAGRSSIGLLRRTELAEVAIDPSLAAVIVTDSTAQRLVQGIAAIAGALGLPVTAQGVEDRVQAKLLRLAGCEHLEGPCFGSAMAPEVLSLALANSRFAESASTRG